MALETAREHLDLAKRQWERASTDWWPPADPASCVTNAFYAYENLIVAAAEAKGRVWVPDHLKKAELASALAHEGILTRDVQDTILRLNNLRKDVSYGEPGDQLASADLEDIVADLGSFCEEVEQIIEDLEATAEEGEEAEEEGEAEDE